MDTTECQICQGDGELPSDNGPRAYVDCAACHGTGYAELACFVCGDAVDASTMHRDGCRDVLRHAACVAKVAS